MRKPWVGKPNCRRKFRWLSMKKNGAKNGFEVNSGALFAENGEEVASVGSKKREN